MAVAGQSTSAYWLQLVGGAFPPGEKTTRLWQDLPSVDDAVRRILAGERVLVAGPDVFAVKAAALEALAQGGGENTPRQ